MNQNTPVFFSFLDATKAFDKINHQIIFKKLILRGVPFYFVRLLWYWHKNQKVCKCLGVVKYRLLFLSLMVFDKEVSLVHSCLQCIDDLSRLLNNVRASGAGTFFGQGGLKIVRSCQRLGGEAPQTPLFSHARF